MFSTSTWTPIRLVGGAASSEGRVEVFHNNKWGTVCDAHFDYRAARVVCNILELPRLGLQWFFNLQIILHWTLFQT